MIVLVLSGLSEVAFFNVCILTYTKELSPSGKAGKSSSFLISLVVIAPI
nr:MAG TPA: hypothetical protein [Caudoviricetes sp.]